MRLNKKKRINKLLFISIAGLLLLLSFFNFYNRRTEKNKHVTRETPFSEPSKSKEFRPYNESLQKNKKLSKKEERSKKPDPKKSFEQNPSNISIINTTNLNHTNNLGDLETSKPKADNVSQEIRKYWDYEGPSFLRSFNKIKDKALLTAEEKTNYKEMLSNVKVIRSASSVLVKEPEEPNLDLLRKKDRMLSVLFLKEALQSEENPSYGEVLDSIVDILMTNNFSDKQTMELRRSLAQDKLILMGALLNEHPELAKEVHQSVRDGVLHRIYSLALTLN